MSAENSITVDVVSDVVCPWCFIGQKRLDKAIAAASDVDVRVSWRPFQLDPTIPPGGMDRRQYMLGKFGSEERIQQIHARIEPLGEAEGIHFAFGAIKVAANTLDAHRVIRWAGAAGEDVQNRLVRRLFQLNFEEGANIGDHAVLVKAAGEAGMDASVVETLLPTDADVEAVRNEITTASRMGITGVPCFLLEGKYAVMGAQDADT
ncbi:MAG: DsbA family oxidoreductase, partial [Mesorhizobium sp.]